MSLPQQHTSTKNIIEDDPQVKKLSQRKSICEDRIRRAGIVLKNKSNQILIVQGRLCPKWGFPKGGKELREKAFDCAHRELLEETMVKILPQDILLFCFIVDSIIHYVYHTDRTPEECNARVGDLREIRALQWINEKDLINLTPVNRGINAYISRYLLKPEENNSSSSQISNNMITQTIDDMQKLEISSENPDSPIPLNICGDYFVDIIKRKRNYGDNKNASWNLYNNGRQCFNKPHHYQQQYHHHHTTTNNTMNNNEKSNNGWTIEKI